MNVAEEQRKEKLLTNELAELKNQILQTTTNSKKQESDLDQELQKLTIKIQEQEKQKQILAKKIEVLEENEKNYQADIELLSQQRQKIKLQIDDEQEINGQTIMLKITLEKKYDQLNVEEELKNEGKSVLIKLKGVINDKIEEFEQEIGLLRRVNQRESVDFQGMELKIIYK